jgi:hypothetical protein
MKPPIFSAATSLSSQTLYPLPDEMYPHFIDGCTAQCYRYNSNPKVRANFVSAFKLWMESIRGMRREVDREREFRKIKPARSIIGAGGSSAANLGPFWPFNYPVS